MKTVLHVVAVMMLLALASLVVVVRHLSAL